MLILEFTLQMYSLVINYLYYVFAHIKWKLIYCHAESETSLLRSTSVREIFGFEREANEK